MENEKEFKSGNQDKEERGKDFVEDKEGSEVKEAMKELEEGGEVQVQEIKEKGILADVEEMKVAVERTTGEVKEAENTYNTEEQEENRLESAKRFLEENHKVIEDAGTRILEEFKKTGKVPDAKTTDAKLSEDLIAIFKDQELLEDLEEKGLINNKMLRAINLLIPVIDRTIEFNKEVGGGEKFAEAMKGLEKGTEEERDSKKIIEETIVAIFSSTDAEKDTERIAAAGALLLKYGGRVPHPAAALAVRALGASLQIPAVQRYLSSKFREQLEESKKEGKSEEETAKEVLEEIDL